MSRPTLVMVPRLPEGFVERLRDRYTVIGPIGQSTPEAMPREAAEARALLTMGTLRTDAALLHALPKLELVCCYGTGHEGVDLGAAAARGVVVANAGEANAAVVAEYALALCLAVTRQVASGDGFIRAGRWKGNSVERMPMRPGFGGRRLGIYGLGAVGRRIVPLAQAFGVEVAYHGRAPHEGVDLPFHDTLEGLAAWADILVVAARATPENRHAVNGAILSALGPEGYLVNIARGVVVDETALCDALEAGTIRGAALDVFEHEPNVPERLKQQPNALLTPHIAANATAAQEAQQAAMLDNLDTFFAGRSLARRVGAPLGA